MMNDESRIGFLARETLEEWTRRFLHERGLPALTSQEMAEVLALSAVDELGAHQ